MDVQISASGFTKQHMKMLEQFQTQFKDAERDDSDVEAGVVDEEYDDDETDEEEEIVDDEDTDDDEIDKEQEAIVDNM